MTTHHADWDIECVIFFSNVAIYAQLDRPRKASFGACTNQKEDGKNQQF